MKTKAKMKTTMGIVGGMTVGMLLSGCTLKTHFVQSDAATPRSGVRAGEVRVYAEDKPAFSYRIIGPVAADVAGDGEGALNALREEAAKMGADAVIGARLTKITSYSGRSGINGIAVRRQ